MRLTTAIILGPLVWMIAFIVTSVILEKTDAVELGLAVTACSSTFGFLVLIVLRQLRDRERRRFERR